MIQLTRLKGTTFGVNPDLVSRWEQSPDTHIYMMDNSSYIVRETPEELTMLIARFKALVLRLAMEEEPAGAQLSLVPASPDTAPAPAVPLRPGK